jgi:hypothetical protein
MIDMEKDFWGKKISLANREAFEKSEVSIVIESWSGRRILIIMIRLFSVVRLLVSIVPRPSKNLLSIAKFT